MTAKHLTKNAMSHKLVFLAVGIAIAMIAAFSICATIQANAQHDEQANNITDWEFVGNGGNIIYAADSRNVRPASWSKRITFNEILSQEDKDAIKFAEYCEISQGKITYINDNITKWIRIEFRSKDTYGRSLLRFGMQLQEDNCNEADIWTCKGLLLPEPEQDPISITIKECEALSLIFNSPNIVNGVSVAGQVWDAKTNMPVPFANVVYCQYNPWWDMYLPVEGVEAVKTDMWGWYTIEGITEEMLPGKVFVYDGIKKIGESELIWFFPEDMETLYMWPIVINQEQPDPPVPPTPPDPPVPPGPVPPEPVPPVPPVPPTPVPTPDNPGGGIAQTSDNTGNALVIFAMVALLGAGVLTGRKLYNR